MTDQPPIINRRGHNNLVKYLSGVLRRECDVEKYAHELIEELTVSENGCVLSGEIPSRDRLLAGPSWYEFKRDEFYGG